MGLGNLFKTAVGIAPYASNMLAQRKAQEQADQDRDLRRMAQIRAEQDASDAATQRYILNAANVEHLNAETKKLSVPPPQRTSYDANRGVLVNEDTGVASPVQGLPEKPAGPQQHVVDPVTGEVKFFDPSKPPQNLRVHPAPKPDQIQFLTSQDAQGNPVYAIGNKTTQTITPTGTPTKPPAAGAVKNLPAPLAAKVGQAGEMIKKAADVLPMIEGLNVSLGQSASADIASHGIGIKGIATVPGSKGLGNMMMNNKPAYAQYQAALSPFILAAAHALSGARINQDQVEQIRKSIEIAPGDVSNPQVVEQKRKNMLDLINSIAGSLPADAISLQESQIDEKALKALEGYGYKRATPKNAAPQPNTPPQASAAKPGTHPLVSKYGITPPSGDDEE